MAATRAVPDTDSGARPQAGGLAALLQPHPQEEFLASSWGKSYLHVRGWPGKFAPLMPWPRLNTILKRHRLDYPRLRLVRGGKRVPASSYLKHVGGKGRQAGASVPRLLPAALTEHLREGATLVLDAVDELHEPLERLAAELERLFRVRVQVNCYAGWRTSHGFDLHWDEHDVFILQVAGRKRWSVYGVTKPHPVGGDTSAPRPANAPVWEETLEEGDLLYLPRGFWHVAAPLDEPTLHLTVGVHNRNGLDLLRWLAGRMDASEAFRRDLPRFAAPEERAAHAARLREELLRAWGDDADLLDRYEEHWDAVAEPRPQLGFPWSAAPGVLPPNDDALVRLTAPRPLRLEAREGVAEFACNGKRWRFAAEALVVLRPLNEGRALSIKELCEAARGTVERDRVRALLAELIRHGLVATVEE